MPLAALAITLIIAAIFYGRLPAETAYRFSGGVPVSTAAKGAFLGWALAVQAVFTLAALGMTLFVTSAAQRLQMGESRLNYTVFSIIGNIIAMPQIIIGYAIVDIFLYNIYGKSLPTLWIFTLVILLGGGVVLAVCFARAIMQSKKMKKNNNISGSTQDVS